MNKIVCYTCITNGYDTLKDPLIVSKDIDYIVFSDRFQFSNIWQFRKIPDDLKYLDVVKQQRILKICPHRYLPEYNISIWVDGSFSIKGDLNKFIQNYDLHKTSIYSRIHPCRKCIYDEAKACIELNKDSKEVITRQINRYETEGYPKNIGMVETGILLRRHNDRRCQIIDNAWATELLNESRRDQLSFNYVCWKNKFLPGYLTSEFNVNNEYFELRKHG